MTGQEDSDGGRELKYWVWTMVFGTGKIVGDEEKWKFERRGRLYSDIL